MTEKKPKQDLLYEKLQTAFGHCLSIDLTYFWKCSEHFVTKTLSRFSSGQDAGHGFSERAFAGLAEVSPFFNLKMDHFPLQGSVSYFYETRIIANQTKGCTLWAHDSLFLFMGDPEVLRFRNLFDID